MSSDNDTPNKKKPWVEPRVDAVPLEATQMLMVICKRGMISGPSIVSNCNPGANCYFQSPTS
ncbi:hypothetical protein ACFL2Q_05050 [Thermodesulfobacteriota bacterium]